MAEYRVYEIASGNERRIVITDEKNEELEKYGGRRNFRLNLATNPDGRGLEGLANKPTYEAIKVDDYIVAVPPGRTDAGVFSKEQVKRRAIVPIEKKSVLDKIIEEYVHEKITVMQEVQAIIKENNNKISEIKQKARNNSRNLSQEEVNQIAGYEDANKKLETEKNEGYKKLRDNVFERLEKLE